jgi:Uma2 family endonuclease
MATVSEYPAPTWRFARLRRYFDDIPAERILMRPRPGTATEEDLIFQNERGVGLCELVNGCLIEKAMGYNEAFLAGIIIHHLVAFVREHDLGIVLAPDGMIRLMPGLVRVPDISFISWETLGVDEIPDVAVGDQAPDLAIEIISRGNTRKEMQRKLGEYFASGVKAVWLVYPRKKRVDVYAAADKKRTVTSVVDGGKVLPGFKLSLADLFTAGRRCRSKE